MDSVLHKIFELEHKSNRDRARFLSRLFGIFSERIVSNWAKNPRCTYRDLGRPTIKSDIGSGSHTLDFTLQDRNTGKTYICEMKCEIEYLNFKHFVLTNSSHLVHHGKPAFEVFLQSANPDNRHTTFIGKKRIKTDGAILIWGSATPEGRSSVIEAQGFHDVISIEDICSDLINWECAGYVEVVEQLREWSNRLFDGLLGKEVTPSSDAIVSPLFRAAKSIRAPSSSSKNERKESNRTPEQEQVLHELADALGWPQQRKKID